jgi:hypothetical protein
MEEHMEKINDFMAAHGWVADLSDVGLTALLATMLAWSCAASIGVLWWVKRKRKKQESQCTANQHTDALLGVMRPAVIKTVDEEAVGTVNAGAPPYVALITFSGRWYVENAEQLGAELAKLPVKVTSVGERRLALDFPEDLQFQASLASSLRDLGFAFGADHKIISPSDFFASLRDKHQLITGPYTEIGWSGPGKWSLTIYVRGSVNRDEALKLAKKTADKTDREVTLRDSNYIEIEIVSPTKH